MAASLSTALRTHLCDGGSLSDALTGGFIHFFDGPVPDSADDAVDGACTLLCKMAASTDGTTGVTFDAASNGALPKAAAETWDGIIVASGQPTFFRFCASGDAGTAAATTEKRWQGTAGGAGTDCPFTDPVFVDNDSNRKGLDIAELRFPA